jgi:hypothetical protein
VFFPDPNWLCAPGANMFANALSTTVVFLLAIPIILAIGGAIHENKEEEQKRQAEFERKQRV